MDIIKSLTSFVTTVTGRDKLKQQLTHDPTAGYRANPFFSSEILVNQLPPYTPRTGELMLRSDPMIEFAMNVRNAALMAADVEIKAKSPVVQAWVAKQWNTAWNSHRTKLVNAKKWGYAAIQVVYRTDHNGLLHVDRMKDFHPWDVQALERGGEVCGAAVKGMKLQAPQVVWQTFNGLYDSPYGNGLLRRMYPPWYEKWMDSGAKKLGQLRMMKDAYIGDQFYYPANVAVKTPDGKQIPWSDILREMGERRLSGGALTLPMLYDNNGNKLVEYKPPQDVQGGTHIFEWEERLDKQILRGADVPLEVVEAQENGGFSGRSIPFMVVLSVCSLEFAEIVRSFVEMTLRPAAWLNWGGEPEFEIVPKSLVESFARDASGSAMGGGAIGSQQGAQPAPQAAPQAAQFDVGDKWITIGGKQSGGKDHAGGFPVQIDENGIILKGGPAALRGKHVSEVGNHFDQQRQNKTRERDAKSPIGTSRSYSEIAKYQADKWGVSTEFYDEAAHQIWTERTVEHKERENAKARARKRLNLTAGDIARLDNQGFDHASKHDRLRGLDVIGRELASEYPSLGWGEGYGSGDDRDYGELAWELIKEGKQDAPSRISREFHEAVDGYLEGELRRHGKKVAKPKQEAEFEFGANQFDLSADEDTATLAAAAAFSRAKHIGRLMRKQIKGTTLHDPQLLGSLETSLRLLSDGIGVEAFGAMHAAGMFGAAAVVNNIPPAMTPLYPPRKPPELPPVTTGFPDDDEPQAHFPALEDAITTLQNAPIDTARTYQATAEKAKQGAFAITGDISRETTAKIRDLLTETIQEGGAEDEFAAKVGKMFEDGPLSENHLRTVFRTNTASAFSGGQQRAVEAVFVQDAFPYRRYYATTDARVRKEHLALESLGLNGTSVYRADDPVWREFQPPFDFGCRCHWSAYTVGQAAKAGVVEAQEWIARAKEMAQGDNYHAFLSRTAPVQPEFVSHPPFHANPAFIR